MAGQGQRRLAAARADLGKAKTWKVWNDSRDFKDAASKPG